MVPKCQKKGRSIAPPNSELLRKATLTMPPFCYSGLGLGTISCSEYPSSPQEAEWRTG
jgi:hypothetical protein